VGLNKHAGDVMRFPSLRPFGRDNLRVDLVEEDFRNRVWEEGTLVDWQQACDCPCGTVSSIEGRTAAVRDFPLDCPLCDGKGKVYSAPQEIIVLMTSSSSSEEVYSVWGEYSSGTIYVTFLPENLPMEWDRVTLKQGSRLYSESRIRKGVRDRLRYPITKRKIISGSETDPTVPVEFELGVSLCYKGLQLGESSTVPLVEGVDFSITTDGLIDWTLGVASGTAPDIGERYAVRYFARPVFVIRDFPYVRRDFYEEIRRTLVYQNYPIKTLALLEHLSSSAPNPPAGDGGE
jgi:hypothetical protein